MRTLAIALVFAAAACSPPATTEAPETPAAEESAVDYGPYANTWAAGEEASFRHTLHAETPGEHVVTIEARTESPGGETVAVYPIGPDGNPASPRVMFVIATVAGSSESTTVEFPASGEGVPVAVVVEHDRRFGGAYTLRVEP